MLLEVFLFKNILQFSSDLYEEEIELITLDKK